MHQEFIFFIGFKTTAEIIALNLFVIFTWANFYSSFITAPI